MAVPGIVKYDQTLSEKVKDALEGAFGNIFRSYYIGDPLSFPKSSLPAIVVEKQAGVISQDATGFDQSLSTILIILADDKKVDLKNPGRKKTSHVRFSQWVEGRDPTTKQYLDQSVMGVLRKQFTLNEKITDQDITIEYGVNVRPAGLMTAEARITVVMSELVEIGSRT